MASETITGSQRERLEATYTHRAFGEIPHITGEFWTSRQRQMHSLHYVISYRASFKPELPHFFIEAYSETGDTVLDPFGGRGTTALQAVMMDRQAVSADVNPLHARILAGKLHPAHLDEVEAALKQIDFTASQEPLELGMFYHPQTERELLSLRQHLAGDRRQTEDFIELVALSRLHGHSGGFFSVYSFPQISVLPEAQKRINRQRDQRPEYRNVAKLILRKARRALRDGDVERIRQAAQQARILTDEARELKQIADNSIDLIVTSPPFLNKADYVQDNWLEFWFCGINAEPLKKKIFVTPKLEDWRDFMREVMATMHRVLRPGGRTCIEVGEVLSKDVMVHLDEVLVDIAADLAKTGVHLVPETMYVHQQDFTKLANCFRVDNNSKGTNTNRIVVFRKD